MPKTCPFLRNWRNFAKSGHTGSEQECAKWKFWKLCNNDNEPSRPTQVKECFELDWTLSSLDIAMQTQKRSSKAAAKQKKQETKRSIKVSHGLGFILTPENILIEFRNGFASVRPSIVTRFGEIFLPVYFAFGKLLSLLWQFFSIGQIFIVANGQTLKKTKSHYPQPKASVWYGILGREWLSILFELTLIAFLYGRWHTHSPNLKVKF